MNKAHAKEIFLTFGLETIRASCLSRATNFIYALTHTGTQKNKRQVIACSLLAAAQILTPTATFAMDSQCTGNGCDSLSFYWDSGCHKIRNIGSRPVKFTWGLFSGRLNPSETTSMMNPFGGGCVSGIVGSRTAYLD